MLRKVSAFSLIVFLALSALVFSQTLDGSPYAPGKDPDIDMYMANWKESIPRHTHGTLVERDIFTQGDQMNPKTKGAILKFANRFTYSILEARSSTTPTTLKNEQEIFYITSGKGSIKAGNKTFSLHDGIAILMPPNLKFTMANTGDEPITMYLVCEPVPEGFQPNKEMLVRDENTIPLYLTHWCMNAKILFRPEDGLATLDDVEIVIFDPMTIGHPHIFIEGSEEVWTAANGTITAWIGKEVREQPDGTAYMVPPNGKITHSNINASNKPLKMFYFCKYNAGKNELASKLQVIKQPFDGRSYTPDVDINIDMYMRNWKESMPQHTHGSLVERAILTQGDQMNPTSRGAVLTYVNRFTYATLESGASTIPTTLTGEQEIFYIISGKGTIKAGNKTADLYENIAVLMPPDLEFTMQSTSDKPLIMYLINEPIHEGFHPNQHMLVKDENTTPVMSYDGHWCHIVKNIFGASDGLATINNVLTVGFNAMTIGHPHRYFAGSEEVWTALKGTSIAWIGKQIRVQTPGTAYMVPPDGEIMHSNINLTGKPIKMFYFLKSTDPNYPM